MNELDAAVGALDQDLELARKRLTEAQVEVEELSAERRALLAAIDRVRRRPRLAPAAGTGQYWLDMSRTDAVEAVLKEAFEAMSPAQITEELGKHGRDDEPGVVSAALSYLNKKGRAWSPKYGLWVNTPEVVAVTGAELADPELGGFDPNAPSIDLLVPYETFEMPTPTLEEIARKALKQGGQAPATNYEDEKPF
jgi:hypothetical protein